MPQEVKCFDIKIKMTIIAYANYYNKNKLKLFSSGKVNCRVTIVSI